MNQPGVYFTLDAPFVSIVGLYTNVLEGPGVISSQDGHYPALAGDAQLDFLKRRAAAARPGPQSRRAGRDHRLPPPTRLGRREPRRQQRPRRRHRHRRHARPASGPTPSSPATPTSTSATPGSVDGREIPYVVAGSGGFAATPPTRRPPRRPTHRRRVHARQAKPIVEFGYLTVTVDMSKPQPATSPSSSTTAPTPDIHDTTPPQPQDRQDPPPLRKLDRPDHSTCLITQKSRARLLLVT